ncbi:MAG: CDP-alcohol phosphatidyltransferase family protein [Bacteroides sp.]|nr:CDP-alcohol phosphatidyltransferase family protein [Bacteroides sp.]MCM1379293.1 CDP-alcohol phosphatidyltransferase family protein [Bacteroides sp.]MCM1445048.1 CDP-alcohol phosphatidyltransferase family protein [Prevotella sp.]
MDSDFKSSLKSLDTEEHIDLWFYRRIGWAEAKLAARLGISPNAITIASIFIGIAAGICFYPTNIWVNIGGLLLLTLANSFDSADGQLARITGKYSQIGRILDGVAGNLWFITIYVCICLRTSLTVGWFEAHPWVIWTVALISGGCHAFQAAMADFYRQMHLRAVNGTDEFEGSTVIKDKALNSRGIKRLFLLAYWHYTRWQEALTPNALRMCAMGPLSNEFRQGSLPLMKWANVLTFNWRSITLAVCLLCGAPWVYFICELTLGNAILAYMILSHERLCQKMIAAVSPTACASGE